MPLSHVCPLRAMVVAAVEAAEGDAQRLKRLGICVGRQVQLLKAGDPLILRVHGTRVGVSGRLAGGILVRPCDACPA